MQLDELVNMVSRLPPDRQQEVIDFAAFLEQRYGAGQKAAQNTWSEHDFKAMSIQQAMRDLDHEPELYSEDDIREGWQ